MIDRLNSAFGEHYVIERELGEGGMATVYLAQDLRHHRKVALKVLKPALAAMVGAERFLAEIETTARLQHPNILPLFDSGEADGFLFYVMPFVEGESLHDRLDRERQLPVEEAVRIAREVSEALQYAHEQGVVHRDIKPANIMLSRGRPLLADFGIALALSAAGGERLTETGLSLGTPHYMSPEQATGDRVVGPASDIYSLGCVLYEMLVGEPPYTGSTAQAILGKIIAGSPAPVTQERRAVPPNVEAVVAKALEKLPADRFMSAADFAKALDDPAFRHGASGGSGVAPTARRRTATVAAWVALGILGGALAVATMSPDRPRPLRRFSLSIPGGDEPSELAFSPDGSALVLAEGPEGSGDTRSLHIRRLDDLALIPIPESADPTDWVVSPDGSQLVFGNATGIHVTPLSGGSVRTLVEDKRGNCCLVWGRDGYVYYSVVEGAFRVRIEGGDPEVVLARDEVSGIYYYTPVGDGSRGLFVTAPYGDAQAAQVEWVDLATGSRRVITRGDRPVLTEAGYLLFDRDDALYALRLDLGSMKVLQGPVRMVERIAVNATDAMFALSESGDLAYWVAKGGDVDVRELVWVDRDGTAAAAAPAWEANFESVEVSPDGTRVAVAIGSLNDTQIWVGALDGGPTRRVTSFQGMNRRPVWSPDGRTLAFISDRSGRRAVYSVPVDGIVTPELLLEHPGKDVDEVSWSPDGAWLVYRTGTGNGDRDIYARRLRPDTATIVVSALPGVDERAPVLSPNGRWLAYVSNENGRNAVWVKPFPDVGSGSRQVSPGAAAEPVWSTNGDELFFRSSASQMALAITDPATFATGSVRSLFAGGGYLGGDPHRAYAYDGGRDRFMMIRVVQPEGAPAQLILVQNFMEELKARLGG